MKRQMVDPLEPAMNRGGLCGGALCMFDSGKNLSQHCTLRYDASCPGDAPLCLKCSEVCIVLDAPSLPASNDGA